MSIPIIRTMVDGEWVSWHDTPPELKAMYQAITNVPLDPTYPALGNICPECEEDYYIRPESLFFGVIMYRCDICDHAWEVFNG